MKDKSEERIRTTVYPPNPNLAVIPRKQMSGWHGILKELISAMDNGLYSALVARPLSAALEHLRRAELNLDSAVLLRGDEEGNKNTTSE
jgi:hypothetical protein